MRKNEQLRFFEDPRLTQRDACGVGFVASVKGVASHKIVAGGLTMLSRLDHRGGLAADGKTSDGAGVMLGMPHSYFNDQCQKLGFKLPDPGKYGVGQLFLPKDPNLLAWSIALIEEVVDEENCEVLGWRDVPVDSSVLGPIAAASEPAIKQIFIRKPRLLSHQQFLWRLFVIRKIIEVRARNNLGDDQKQIYFCSLSPDKIVYKGLLLSHLISAYYTDLEQDSFTATFSLVHQRFSTNTMPSWPLAQPFRMIGHNGEINTLRGNINWMRARQEQLQCSVRGDDLKKIGSVVTPFASDSAILDNAIEFLLHTGRPLSQVLSMLIPEPWENRPELSRELRDYYEYQSCLMEPWDGPAFVGFAFGNQVGALLDRNGLRPGRYWLTADGMVIMGSEAGLLDIDSENIIYKGRLRPGRMFIVDMDAGEIRSNESIKSELMKANPYGQWLNSYRVKLSDLPIPVNQGEGALTETEIIQQQMNFAFTKEDLQVIIAPMANEGTEPIGSMGNDTPIAILSRKSPLLFEYFKQLFAQVTNPPIDAIREEIVTSLSTTLGAEFNLMVEEEYHCQMIRLKQPILTNYDLLRIRRLDDDRFQSRLIPIGFQPRAGGMKEALKKIADLVDDAIDAGASLLILSDRNLPHDEIALPSLLVSSAVHHHLISKGTRTKCSLILESGEPREVHHFCLLLGYGISAINPYLVFETIRNASAVDGLSQDLSFPTMQSNYIKAVNKGLLKVMSKMGISTIQSYRGAQIFEAVGLSQDLVDEYFTWTPTRIGGLRLEDLEKETIVRYERFQNKNLPSDGKYAWRRDGETHLHGPDMISTLQNATRISSREEFAKYCKTVDDQSRANITLRSLLQFKKTNKPLDIDQVEPVSSILKRFATGAMSFGSISREAHETIAIAMNRLGGKSNSGEGGEDERRFIPDDNGDLRRSAIKQVASGRFGVTINYLSNAEEIQIKIAQGAKPGEGGQLPGHKVDKAIATVRHSTPGVALISPPPHHDIYSIEDLAQLIHDLKNANPKARISVKLVSAVGVGTIAAGVAKAKSDVILISGYEGGTGASPISSIKHAGVPWELGLSDTHRTLVENGLRSRVTLQTDGQLRTPRDIAIAAMLGAEEWSIGTGALVVLGCIMMRKCHLNTCPVGIATQNKELRKRFAGQPEHLINYFILLAEGLREIMAELGITKVDHLIGRTDLLEVNKDSCHDKASLINFDNILSPPQPWNHERVFKSQDQDHKLQDSLDNRVLLPKLWDALKLGKAMSLDLPINNTDRTVGTILSGELTKIYGIKGLKENTIQLNFKGAAGQSFLAFGAPGITATVAGEVNDYCGKGLSGAKIIVRPPEKSILEPERNIICGNTTLYGATSGELYISGIAGERFAVRNSGAIAVAEGAGDHCCEYMTGGRVVILGSTGRNFGAGMSGGIAYVYDEYGQFSSQVNMELVELEHLSDTDEVHLVKSLIHDHWLYTKSRVAQRILDDWELELVKFVRVMPTAYREALKLASPRRLYQMSHVGVGALSFESTCDTNLCGQGGIHG